MVATQMSLDLTVIVPTRNEAGNVRPLVERLDAALNGSNVEILFVDDSSDRTCEEIEGVAGTASRPIRLIHRAPGERHGGLGSAVLAGLRASQATWVVVMDGDLQHPPEVVPELYRLGTETDADVVVASRYVGGGSASGLASATREAVSGAATRLAKALFPRRLGCCSDPMSGFFAVRRDSVDLDRMRPWGYKILLEILARSRRLKIREQAFEFQPRHSGESKASFGEGVVFIWRMLCLRAAALFGRHSEKAMSVAAFGAVGVTGIVVNSAALSLFVEVFGAPLLLAVALATQASTLWNFLFSDRLVFRGSKHRSGWQRFLGFAVINNVVLLARLPLFSWLVHSVGVGYLVANVVTLLAAFAVRFIVSDRYLFERSKTMTMTPERLEDSELAENWLEVPAPSASPRRADRQGPVDVIVDLRDVAPVMHSTDTELVHRYDIHGIVTIASTVALGELEYFRSETLEGSFDIEIRGGHFDNGPARHRTRVTQYASLPAVSYEEQLGRRGSDFHVDMTDGIKVIAGPMLIRSPHVLYTNVIEALLRFVLVSRGYILLHSACLDLDGRGVMLSARTDTGKTGTILRLLRENRSSFLSDDMTILAPNGLALCYPKPLTISQHTLRAVNAGDLTKKEWRRLRLQSRLHSKEGRGIGARLGEMNCPIMTLNALTQYIVPPPKYVVDRLVPCNHATVMPVEEMFIIERDSLHLSDIDPTVLIDELIDNTDDAYGFPPFRYFAPALQINGERYEELRARERHILARALTGVRARRLATPDFSWADNIPVLVGGGTVDLTETTAAPTPNLDPIPVQTPEPVLPPLVSPNESW